MLQTAMFQCSRQTFLATLCAGVSSAVCLVGLIYAVVSWVRVPTATPSQPANEERKKALDLRVELSAKLFDVGLLLLGVLWGLVLAEKVVIRFSRWQDVALFASSNLLLLISLFSHLVYRMRLANLLWALGAANAAGGASRLPDIHEPLVNASFRVQWILFYASLISEFLTILVVKVVGGPP
jgi:hypothetical protein